MNQPSKRVVALQRRMKKEQVKYRALLSMFQEGKDGKFRQRGKFVSAALVASNRSEQVKCLVVIADIRGKLKRY